MIRHVLINAILAQTNVQQAVPLDVAIIALQNVLLVVNQIAMLLAATLARQFHQV